MKLKNSIELSKDQFFTLLKAVYISNWIANATRIDGKKEDFFALEHLILCYASQFGFSEHVVHQETTNVYYPTDEFPEEHGLQDLIKEYEDDIFWDDLAHRLGERDFCAKYTPAQRKKMTQGEHFTLLYRFIDGYSAEFEEFGLERLAINKLR